jgi:hypothetical protein
MGQKAWAKNALYVEYVGYVPIKLIRVAICTYAKKLVTLITIGRFS